MRHGLRILAVVPARSGSKGIPHKNLQPIAGKPLIGWAAATLGAPESGWIDRSVISTDSPDYAAEAQQHGLAAPFLRPAELSSDNAGAVETMQHAVREMERRDVCRYDVALIVEPTSPFRLPADLAACVDLLVRENADSVVAVSAVNPKYHPHKILKLENGRLGFYDPAGATVKARQSLVPLYCKNGVCYALTRACLMEHAAIFTARTLPYVMDRLVLNIDDLLELELARHYAEVVKVPPFGPHNA